MVLDSQPTENVVLNISSENTKEAKVSESILILQIQLNIPQEVTITGVDDEEMILQSVVKF